MLVDEGWGFLFYFILCILLFVFSTALPDHSHVICPICISLDYVVWHLYHAIYTSIHSLPSFPSQAGSRLTMIIQTFLSPATSVSSSWKSYHLGNGNLQMKVPSRHPDQMSEPLELVHFDAKEAMPTLLSILMSELIT